MKWMEHTGFKKRGVWEQKDEAGVFILHNNASEPGITLRHGPRRGRLIVTGTFRPLAKEHPSDRKPVDGIYSCAVYSDDRGKSWRVSGLFPESATEEAALVELGDGTLYFNSRCCDGFYDKSLARELKPEETAWKAAGTREHQALTRNYLETMEPCEPLRAVEPDRPRPPSLTDHKPLYATKKA